MDPKAVEGNSKETTEHDGIKFALSQLKENLKGYKRLLRLWFSQEGKCPICEGKITKQTSWNIHHLQRRVDGGNDTFENIVLLHPNCHRQVHSQEIKVKKAVFKRTLRMA